MEEKHTFESFLLKSEDLRIAYHVAISMSTDHLLREFNKLEYKSLGFGALMIVKMIDSDQWQCFLRNDANWKEEKPECTGLNLTEALAKFYAWCLLKGYIVK